MTPRDRTQLGPTRVLARFLARGDVADLPPAVLHQAKRCLVDWLAVGFASQREPSVRILADHVAGVGAAAQATLVGRPTRTTAPLAALANGHAAHVLDFDDTYASDETTLHGSAPILSAAMAVGEWRRASGSDVLTAFALGFEAAVHVARALGPAHYAAGWHVTGTAGRIGAAGAAARLLRLDEERTSTALALAATQAAGMKAVYGSAAKAFHAAKAAHDGVLSAILARDGFTCPDAGIEGPRGLLDLYSARPVPRRLRRTPRSRYAILDDGFKPYPCGSLIHAAIDATLDAIRDAAPHPDDVQAIEARVNPHVATTTGRRQPRTGLEAKFSAPHCLAIAVLERRGPRLEDFEDEAVLDPSLARLRRRVRLIPTASYPKHRASVLLRLRGGAVLHADAPHARGTRGRPLTDGELAEKFRALAEPMLGSHASAVLAAAWSFDQAADAGALARATCPRDPLAVGAAAGS